MRTSLKELRANALAFMDKMYPEEARAELAWVPPQNIWVRRQLAAMLAGFAMLSIQDHEK